MVVKSGPPSADADCAARQLAAYLPKLQQENGLRPELVKHYLTMMQSLLQFQDDTGMWRQLIDYEPSWTESSATAMFGYAMLLGIQNDLLDRDPYQVAVGKAWSALAALIDADGNVQVVCVGTGKKNDLDYYLARPGWSAIFTDRLRFCGLRPVF